MAPTSAPKPPSDDVLASMAEAQDLNFLALAQKSVLVSMIAKMATYIPGLTAKAFMASTMAAADCMLGPIEHIFVTEVGPDGAARNTARNVSSVSAVNVAPSGSVKTATMELGPRGVGKSTAACRASAFKQIRKLAEHIPVCKDGSSPSTLGDSSAAYTFKVLEANPKLMALAYFVDETDGFLNRLESNGLLDTNTELAQWNTGGRLVLYDLDGIWAELQELVRKRTLRTHSSERTWRGGGAILNSEFSVTVVMTSQRARARERAPRKISTWVTWGKASTRQDLLHFHVGHVWSGMVGDVARGHARHDQVEEVE